MTSRTPRRSSSRLNLNSNSFMSRDYSHSPRNKNGSSSSDSIFIYDSRLKNSQLNNSSFFMREADNTGTFSHLFPLNSNYSNRNSTNNSPVIDRNGTNLRGTLFSVSESSQSELPPLGLFTAPAMIGNNHSSQGSLSSSTGKSRKTVSTSVILDGARTPESYVRQLPSGVAQSFPSGVSTSSLSTSNYKSLPETQESIRPRSVITEGVPINYVPTQAETLTRVSSSTYYSLPVDSPAGLKEDTAVSTLGTTPASSHGQQKRYSAEIQKNFSHRDESIWQPIERLSKSRNLPVLNERRRFTEYALPSSTYAGREEFSTSLTRTYSTVFPSAVAATATTIIPQNRLPKRFTPPLSPDRLYSIPRRFESIQLRDSYGTVSLNKVPYNSDLVGLTPSHLDSSSSSDIFLSAIDLSRHIVKSSSGSSLGQFRFDIPEDSVPVNIKGQHTVTIEAHVGDNNIENVPLLISSPLSTLSTIDANTGQHLKDHTTTSNTASSINQYKPRSIGIRNLRGAQGTVGSIMGSTIFVTPQPNAVFPKRSTQPLRSHHLHNQEYYNYDSDNANDYNYDYDNDNESDKPSIEHIQRVSSESIRSFDSTTYEFHDIFSVFNVIKLLLLGLIAPPFFFMVVFNESCGIPDYTLMRMLMNKKHRALLLFKEREFWDVDLRWFKKMCLICGLLELLLVFAAIGIGFGVGIGRS